MRWTLLLLLAILYSSNTLGRLSDTSSESNKKRAPSSKSSIVEEAGETKTSWPELFGMDGEEAKLQLEATVAGKQIFIVPEDSMVTMDYRIDRIRIFVDSNGNVARPPNLG
jgi:hypothetical protein